MAGAAAAPTAAVCVGGEATAAEEAMAKAAAVADAKVEKGGCQKAIKHFLAPSLCPLSCVRRISSPSQKIKTVGPLIIWMQHVGRSEFAWEKANKTEEEMETTSARKERVSELFFFLLFSIAICIARYLCRRLAPLGAETNKGGTPGVRDHSSQSALGQEITGLSLWPTRAQDSPLPKKIKLCLGRPQSAEELLLDLTRTKVCVCVCACVRACVEGYIFHVFSMQPILEPHLHESNPPSLPPSLPLLLLVVDVLLLAKAHIPDSPSFSLRTISWDQERKDRGEGEMLWNRLDPGTENSGDSQSLLSPTKEERGDF